LFRPVNVKNDVMVFNVYLTVTPGVRNWIRRIRSGLPQH